MDAALRRLLDVVVAAALLVLLAPVLGLLAVLVRLTSPGPVFFRQTRIGRGGRPFELLKLRTMRADAPRGRRRDHRRRRPAHHARRRAPPAPPKLDELPQLWNVVRGDMSLVGPRPEVPRYVDALRPAARAASCASRPGLTDPASLAFADEAAVLGRFDDPERVYAEEILPWKLALSLAYLERRTVWTDLGIVARTATHVGRAAVRAAWRQGDTP